MLMGLPVARNCFAQSTSSNRTSAMVHTSRQIISATVLDIGQMRLTLWGFQFVRSLRSKEACVCVSECAMASVHLDSGRTADTTANDTAFGNNLFADFIHFMDTKWMFFMCVIHFIDLFSFASFGTPFYGGFCSPLSLSHQQFICLCPICLAAREKKHFALSLKMNYIFHFEFDICGDDHHQRQARYSIRASCNARVWPIFLLFLALKKRMTISRNFSRRVRRTPTINAIKKCLFRVLCERGRVPVANKQIAIV